MAAITTVIASAGSATRHASIMAAVDSVLSQEGVDVQVLVVLNGPAVSDVVVRDLERRQVTIERLERGSLPHALHYGRRQVQTPFFSFLDDDDLYLPGALAKRVAVLQQRPDVDAVVANGLVERDGEQRLLLGAELRLDTQPLQELFKRNWLASCGGLFRAATVGPEYFREDARYFEWTMTAFLLGLDRRLAYIADATFVVNNTPLSLSKSLESVIAYPRILRTMLGFDLPADIRETLRRRLSTALHTASTAHLAARQRGTAWRYHLESLRARGGLRFLPYTLRLLLPVPASGT